MLRWYRGTRGTKWILKKCTIPLFNFGKISILHPFSGKFFKQKDLVSVSMVKCMMNIAFLVGSPSMPHDPLVGYSFWIILATKTNPGQDFQPSAISCSISDHQNSHLADFLFYCFPAKMLRKLNLKRASNNLYFSTSWFPHKNFPLLLFWLKLIDQWILISYYTERIHHAHVVILGLGASVFLSPLIIFIFVFSARRGRCQEQS